MILLVETEVLHLFGITHNIANLTLSFPLHHAHGTFQKFYMLSGASSTSGVAHLRDHGKRIPSSQREVIFSAFHAFLPSELPDFVRSVEEDSSFIYFAIWL